MTIAGAPDNIQYHRDKQNSKQKGQNRNMFCFLFVHTMAVIYTEFVCFRSNRNEKNREIFGIDSNYNNAEQKSNQEGQLSLPCFLAWIQSDYHGIRVHLICNGKNRTRNRNFV